MANTEIKRSLNTLIARYKLEPGLKDIYVEGPRDRSILQWFLEAKGIKDIKVYLIETIDLPHCTFSKFDLSTNSNRDMVIGLAKQLTSVFGSLTLKVKCVVDTDYDHYLNKIRKDNVLVYTDYTSMEMYCFNKSYLNKFLSLVLSGFSISSVKLLSHLTKPLQRIFLMRLANEELNWNMTWLNDFTKYFSWKRKGIEFDEEGLLNSLLMKNNRIKDISLFRSVIKDFERKLNRDSRHNIRGHDFTHLFFWLVKKAKPTGRGFQDIGTFECSVWGCLELSLVENEGLFLKLASL